MKLFTPILVAFLVLSGAGFALYETVLVPVAWEAQEAPLS
jgi:hypothetical protein